LLFCVTRYSVISQNVALFIVCVFHILSSFVSCAKRSAVATLEILKLYFGKTAIFHVDMLEEAYYVLLKIYLNSS